MARVVEELFEGMGVGRRGVEVGESLEKDGRIP
jgi:hypothetical protein